MYIDLQRIDLGGGYVTGVAFSTVAEQDVVMCADSQRHLRVWNAIEGKKKGQIKIGAR